MDTTHREFVDSVSALLCSDDSMLPVLFDELLHHTRDHFAFESELMRLSGFPPAPIHEGEHDRVLVDFEQAAARLAENDLLPARDLIGRLPQWFALHAATMDRALATHLTQSGVMAGI